jgi:hypothetical protein
MSFNSGYLRSFVRVVIYFVLRHFVSRFSHLTNLISALIWDHSYLMSGAEIILHKYFMNWEVCVRLVSIFSRALGERSWPGVSFVRCRFGIADSRCLVMR